MAQKPQSEMYYKPGKMSEEVEFALREMYEEVENIHQALDLTVDGGPKRRILELTHKNDALQNEVTTLKMAQAVLEGCILKLQTTLIALTAKLDAENVTNLDTNYSSTINTKLY